MRESKVDREGALMILDTITRGLQPGTMQTALDAVKNWILEQTALIPATPEGRQAEALRIKTVMRQCMSAPQRRAEAAFYLDGIEGML